MSDYPNTPIDKVSVELHDLANAYAQKAVSLARDPYFVEAVVKTSVSGFAWALYNAFKNDKFALAALDHELKVQSAAIARQFESGRTNA